MNIIQTSELSHVQKLRVYDLWNAEYPSQLSYSNLSELDNYLNGLEDIRHYLLTEGHQFILGWAVAFKRDNERWFAIILDNQTQGKGYGRLMLNRLSKDYETLNGWVVDHTSYVKKDGSPYLPPLEFYLKNGFRVIPELRMENEQTSAVKIHKSSV